MAGVFSPRRKLTAIGETIGSGETGEFNKVVIIGK